jgi:hypothetical protein
MLSVEFRDLKIRNGSKSVRNGMDVRIIDGPLLRGGRDFGNFQGFIPGGDR